MKYVIDRIVDDLAVLEGYEGDSIKIGKSKLPKGAKEGSSVEIGDNGVMTLFRDVERERRIAEKMRKVWR